MGAGSFMSSSKGKSSEEAFNKACYQARYEDGHGGYTGTIAEKSSYIMIDLPIGRKPIEYAQSLMDEGDHRIEDKWGPAGCIACGDGVFLFFGFASD